jgi:host factor-I protein
MPQAHNVQHDFLEILRKAGVPVAVFLVNGIRLQGQIDSFDQYMILLKGSPAQVIYKRAISTVVPSQDVKALASQDE